VSFTDSHASTGLPGPVERAVRQRRVSDPVILLRAAAIDNAAQDLIGQAEHAGTPLKPGAQETPGDARDAVLLAAQSFPPNPVAKQTINPSEPGNRPASPSPDRARLRKI